MFFLVTIIIFSLITFIFLISKFAIHPTPTFVSHQEFKNIIDKSPYFNSLTPQDFRVRMSQASNKYNEYYKQNIEEFTPTEKAHVAYLVEQANKRTSCFPLLHAIPWKFGKVAHHIENGFPHTLEDTIILSARFFSQLASNHSEQVKTLIHEKMHVFQRLYPHLTDDLIFAWGFRKINNFALTDLPEDRRSNPDIQNVYEKDGYIPYQRFTSTSATSLAHSEPVLIGPHQNVLPITNLDVPSYISQIEHPYEIMAVIIPIVLFNENKDDQYFKATRQWLHKLIK